MEHAKKDNSDFIKSKASIYFHLGMPKTATTFFQRRVFPKLKNIKYSKKRDFWNFRDPGMHVNSGKYLYSWEFHEKLDAILDEILKLYESPNFIYFFRKHEDWAVSKYKYYIRKHGYKSFCAYSGIECEDGVLDLNEFNYSRKIACFKKRSNTRFLLFDYQELNDNFDGVINQICKFTRSRPDAAIVNRKVKISFSDKQLKYLLWLNGMYRYHELDSRSKTLNRIHYRYREYLLHAFAFIAKFLPSFFVRNIELIDPAIVEKIKLKYADDWSRCKYEIEKSKRAVLKDF